MTRIPKGFLSVEDFLQHTDTEAVRIVEKLYPHVKDEDTLQTSAALTMMLASYVTIISRKAGVSRTMADITVDMMAKKIKHMVGRQWAYAEARDAAEQETKQ